MAVKIFNKRWAELGDPKISFFVAKLARPTFSCGIFRRIITINIKLIINANTFNIYRVFYK